MSTEENKRLVVRLFSEAMNNKNPEVVDEIISLSYVNHGFPNTNPGIEGFKEIIEQFTKTFPDMHIDQEVVMAENDMVATKGTWKGTHKGDFMGIAATGKEVEVSFMDMWKFKDGKAVENWVQMDMAGLMQQLR